jgi:putative transposase
MGSYFGWYDAIALTEKKVSGFERAERLAAVEVEKGELALSVQAELLSISRSSIYYQPKPVSEFVLAVQHKIDEIFTAHPYYGSRRIKVVLNKAGYRVGRRLAQSCMRTMGLVAIYPKPNLSKPGHEHKIYPYLLRGLAIERVGQVFGIDITYVRLRGGWCYLVAVLDWYSRYIISWELSQSLANSFVMKAVNSALERLKPEIMNSDQGSHFTSTDYLDLLTTNNIKISMDGKGRAIDNIFTERLWRTLKHENIYLQDYASFSEAHAGLGRYIAFYNDARPHQSLEYYPPADIFFGRHLLPGPLLLGRAAAPPGAVTK